MKRSCYNCKYRRICVVTSYYGLLRNALAFNLEVNPDTPLKRIAEIIAKKCKYYTEDEGKAGSLNKAFKALKEKKGIF